MLGSQQPSAWYIDVEKGPKEWSGDLLAEHPDSERPSYLPGWLYEWMKRWMDGGVDRTAVTVREIIWPNQPGWGIGPFLSPTPTQANPKISAARTSTRANEANSAPKHFRAKQSF